MSKGKKAKLTAIEAKHRQLKLENIALDRMLPHPDNARTHSRQQIRLLGRSIRKHGPMRPILLDTSNQIIAGHGICAAAKLEGMTHFPAIRVDDLTPAQVRAYSILDNRLAEKSQWDKKKLTNELKFLSEAGFSIDDLGFEVAEVDILVSEIAEQDEAGDDDLPACPSGKPVSKLGDCWVLGQHRLVCADALNLNSYATLLGNECAEFVFTDPPYNVKIGGHVSGKGRIRHREFAMASGEQSSEEFASFLAKIFALATQHSIPGAIQQYCMDWRHVHEISLAGRRTYGDNLLNICVWRKTNAGMGSFYRSQHELIFVFRNGNQPHINNIELGRHGRSRSNVWDYAGVNTFKTGRADELKMHPTVKPVGLVADAIKDCSSRGGIVLDPFCGSGTILVASEKTGRVARALEIDPIYVDVAVRRWEKYTGQFAIHESSGLTFGEIKETRDEEEGSLRQRGLK
jgi:DNA modification methylase